MRNHSRFGIGLMLIATTISQYFGSVVLADVTVKKDRSGRQVIRTVQLKVTPAKETVPAFKYRMTVEPHKKIPGNAITHYLRSVSYTHLTLPTTPYV